MTYTLYAKRECPFCWQVKIALHYLRFGYDLIEWDQVDHDAIAALSPQASVPVLFDESCKESLWDSLAIVLYLQDRFIARQINEDNQAEPHTHGLLSDGWQTNKKIREVVIFSNQIAGKGLRDLIFAQRDQKNTEKSLESSLGQWRESLDWLEQRVEGGPSFLSHGFSWADAALAPRFALAEKYGVGVHAGTHPALSAWFASIKKHEAVKAAIKNPD